MQKNLLLKLRRMLVATLFSLLGQNQFIHLKLKTYIYLAFNKWYLTRISNVSFVRLVSIKVNEPSKTIYQGSIDLYWNLLLDRKFWQTTSASNRIPMRMSESTCSLEDPKDAIHADLWLRISTLVWRKLSSLPLVGNPYIKQASDVGNGIHARKIARVVGDLRLLIRKNGWFMRRNQIFLRVGMIRA